MGLISGFILGVLEDSLMKSIIGSLVMAAPLYLIALIYMRVFNRQGVGGGDIKIAFLYGMFLRIPILIFFAYFITFMASGIVILIMKIKGKSGSEIPLIPFMSIGSLMAYNLLFFM